MADACHASQDGVPLCDLDTAVANSIPYVHVAMIIHKILGIALIFAPCFKLNTARLILLYWVVTEMLEIYEPFNSG